MTTPLQQSTNDDSPTWVARGVSILNGMFGDYLSDRGNGLAFDMAFCHQGSPLALTSASLRRAHSAPTRKICVLVHGLACNEGLWSFPGQTENYGTLLQRELGYTPFYLRYNSGLAIAENGKQFAEQLAKLVGRYPGHIDEIVLIGHSMGGLVLRSACHYADEAEQTWVSQVTRVFYLGTPHDGADLEKFAHLTTGVLRAVPNPITRLIGDILNLRSRGVKDLRHGNPLAGGGAEAHPAPPIAWLATAQHYLLLGTLTEDPGHLVSRLLGDGLVRSPGNSGATSKPGGPVEEHIRRFPGIHHLALAHAPAVYQQIREWCNDQAKGLDPWQK